MQEIFEKIIERLQLEQGIAKRYLDFKTAKTYGNAIEIVNQVAEEYEHRNCMHCKYESLPIIDEHCKYCMHQYSDDNFERKERK